MSRVCERKILREHEGTLARHFARSRPDKFDDVSVSYGALGVPLLGDALATIECRETEEVTAGTHSVILAEVRTAQERYGLPVTCFRASMGPLASMTENAVASLWIHMQ